MIKIAHRALLKGEDKVKENTITQIELALKEGFYCELDVWFLDNKWFLGHDSPQTEVNFGFLDNRKFFLHCKNLFALSELTHNGIDADFFAHENDDWVLTREGYIWTFPEKKTCESSIIVDLKNEGKYGDIAGICSDLWI